jgi:CRISPR-associated protein Cas5d
VKFEQVRRNEVSVKASLEREAIFVGPPVRQQRAALVLRDVAYVVHARFSLTGKAGPGDSVAKYAAMFERRARSGQCFQRPCLGSREFAAEFRLLEASEPDPVPACAAGEETLGWIFHDFDWSRRPPRPRFFEARLSAGRMLVPPPESLALRA